MQCTGDATNVLVTLSNVVSVPLVAGSTISFSINNFNSPPTNEAVDAVVVTTYTSTGASIDQCTAYVSGLQAKTIPSNQFIVAEQSSNPFVVNSVTTVTFSITTIDIIGYSDYITIDLPSGTTLTTFSSTNVLSTVGLDYPRISFSTPTLSIYMTGTGTLTAGFQIFFNVANFQAPPSTLTTSNFVLTFLSSSGFPKMASTQTIIAVTSTLSGTSSATLTTVNLQTSYVFSVTTAGAISSSGSIKLVFPTILGVANSTACAVFSGTGMVSAPTCTYTAIDNSITFSNLNSSAQNIAAQTFSMTVNGITNPPSSQTTGSFTMTTIYSSLGGQVDNGTIVGVTATGASIDHNTASISSNSQVNSANGVSYSTTFTVNNPIPAGGYIIVNYPTAVTFDTAAAASSCQVTLNAGVATPTTCSATLGSSYVFNFSNPLSATAPTGTTITLTVAGVATNPASTQPFSPFSISTYHSDGSLIASLTNALNYATTTASALSSAQFSRLSTTNAALTDYTINIIQPSDL